MSRFEPIHRILQPSTWSGAFPGLLSPRNYHSRKRLPGLLFSGVLNLVMLRSAIWRSVMLRSARLRSCILFSRTLLSGILLAGLLEVGYGTHQPAFAQEPDAIPPEVILPLPGASNSTGAASSGGMTPASQSTAASYGRGQVGQVSGNALGISNPNQMVPGQVLNNQQAAGNAAAGFAPINFTPQPGQPNPFALRPVDLLRKQPGTTFAPNGEAAGNVFGGPPPGSAAYRAAPPGAGTSLQSMNQSASQDSSDPTCVLETSKGRIVIRLFQKYAPITVKAFTEMANSGFYNGLKFHRVEPGFVVQGGCPVGNGTGNYVPQGSNQPRFLPLEVSPFLKHNAPGVVAMARQPNDVNTSSCQFYITLNPQPALDQKYTVIGGVLQGMDVVRSIAIGDQIISVSVNP